MNISIDRLLKNYSNARRSWEAWCFMANFNLKPPQPKVCEYIDKDDLLFHLRYLAFKDFHIEMYKILKDSKKNQNKDNIFYLLEKLSSENKRKHSAAQKRLIQLTRSKTTIDRICETRDKFYAHLDKEYENYQGKVLNLLWVLDCFVAVEKAIITLTSRKILQSHLDNIPSKDDCKLSFGLTVY